MDRETVYTIAGSPDDGYAAYDLLGRLAAAGETFGQCVDSLRNRQRSGWLAPGAIHKRPDEPVAQGERAA